MHPGCVAAQLDDAGGDMDEMIAGIKANSRLPDAEVTKVMAEVRGGGGSGNDEDEDEGD